MQMSRPCTKNRTFLFSPANPVLYRLNGGWVGPPLLGCPREQEVDTSRRHDCCKSPEYSIKDKVTSQSERDKRLLDGTDFGRGLQQQTVRACASLPPNSANLVSAQQRCELKQRFMSKKTKAADGGDHKGTNTQGTKRNNNNNVRLVHQAQSSLQGATHHRLERMWSL